MVSFNEKTGKATQPSHIEASQESGKDNSRGNATTGDDNGSSPLHSEKILQSEVQAAILALFASEREFQLSPQVNPEQSGRETAREKTIVPEQSDQELPATILLIDDQSDPANAHLETIGASQGVSENLAVTNVHEYNSQLLAAPPEKTSINSPPRFENAKSATGTVLEGSDDEHYSANPAVETMGLGISNSANDRAHTIESSSTVLTASLGETLIDPPPVATANKAVTGSESANSAVMRKSFVANPNHEPSETHINLRFTDSSSSATLDSRIESVSPVNAPINAPEKMIAGVKKTERKNTSSFRHSPSIKMVSESASAQDIAAGHSSPNSMHISLNADSIEKLAKEVQMSQELAKRLGDLSKRVSNKKK